MSAMSIESNSSGSPSNSMSIPGSPEKADKEKAEKEPMIGLLLLSIFCSAANTVSYKQTLNAFSSPTTNYSFFVSEFSIFLYILQAAMMSAVIMYQRPDTIREFFQIPQRVYMCMGFFDSASSTLGAFAGVYCPGELQTILNQLIIPVTLLGSFYMGDKFSNTQLYGCFCILAGAIVASSGYLFSPHQSSDNSEIPSDAESTGHGGMALPAAIILYLASVVPSAFSNIYKERRMKERDMNEYHTSSVVSFWQLWIGFAFLPLLSLPSLGGMTFDEMKNQLTDGFTCFLGTDPTDPTSDACSSSAMIFMAYVMINFFYNILLLKITKQGSAVLLVISQALSLPITNICFSLPFLMGDDADSLSMCSLIGIVLVVIGFLTYSGFGFARNFMVAQGPPGQMTYAHFTNSKEVIVSTNIALTATELADFMVSSIIQNNLLLFEEMQERNNQQDTVHSMSYEIVTDDDHEPGALNIDISPLGATLNALDVAKETVLVLEKQANVLRNRKLRDEYQISKDIMKSKYQNASPAARARMTESTPLL